MQKVLSAIQFKTSVGISEKYFLYKPITHALYLVAIIFNFNFYTTKSLQQHILSSSLAKQCTIFLFPFTEQLPYIEKYVFFLYLSAQST